MSTAIQSIPSGEYSANCGQTELMRLHPLRYAVVLMVFLWITYSAVGFRCPLSPILHSDSYEGAALRQALFTSAALTALTLMFFTRNLGSALTMNRSMLALSILVPLSVVWSGETMLTVKRSTLFLFGLITLYAIVHSSRKPVYTMLRIVTGSAAAIALVSLAIHFAFGQAYTLNPMRPGLAGITSRPNNLAPIMSIALICSAGIQINTATGFIALRSAQSLIVVSLLMTQSITTLVTTILAFGLYALLNCNNYKRGVQQLLILTVFTICSLIGWGTLKSAAFDVTNRDESLSGRDEVWSIVFVEGLKRPIFGSGYGAFWKEGKGRELVYTWNPRQSHNAYLDLWVDLGVVGLAVLLYAIPGKLYERWDNVKGRPGTRQRKAMAALYASSISYLSVYALAQSYFLRFDTFTFMTLAWTVVLIGNIDQNRIENEFDDPIQTAT